MDREVDAMAAHPRVATPVVEDNRGVYDGSKPLEEIAGEIARTRVRLSATIKALERELAPQRVIEKNMEVLRNALEPPPGPFRDQVWAYAIPLALIVTGLGWLFVLRRGSYRAEAPCHFGEMPVDAVELGETPTPAPCYTNVVDPVEPVSLVDE